MDVAAQEQIHDPLRRQAALLDLTFDAILVRDFATDTIQFWNRGAERMYGFSRDEAIGQISHDLLQTQHPVPVDVAKEVLRSTGQWEGELLHTRRDGTQIVVASRWALQTEQDQPVAILETNTDISKQKQAQQRLTVLAEASAMLASSLDYETTLTSLAQAVVPRIADWCAVHLIDEGGTVTRIAITHRDPARIELAHELERRYPYDPDGATGLPQVLRSGRPELVPHIDDRLLEEVASDDELLRILRELGLTSSMVVPLSARGRILGAITFVAAESGRHYGPEDVALTEVLARRAALAIDNARLYYEAQQMAAEREAILSQMAEAVVIVDAVGRITFRNDAARRIGGSEADSLEATLATQQITTVPGDPISLKELPLARALSEQITIEDARWRVVRTDGTELILQGSATPLVGEDGTLLGAVSTFRDITNRVTLERQRDDFLSAAAHDLKTPLAGLKGLAQVLQRRLVRDGSIGPEQLREGLDRIVQNSNRMTALIDELLDHSRLEMGGGLHLNYRPTDLVSLVQGCVDQQRELTGNDQITLECRVPQLIGMWDPDRLERVIGNLLSNAIKYSPDNTPVAISLSQQTDGKIRRAIVSIQDHGIGIPQEDLPRIFDRFYRGRNVDRETIGTGIGLAGTKQIVEQHGGSIDVCSTEGAGSTFIVSLPMTPADPSHPPNDGHANAS